MPGQGFGNLGRFEVCERPYFKIDDAQQASLGGHAQLDLRVGKLMAHRQQMLGSHPADRAAAEAAAVLEEKEMFRAFAARRGKLARRRSPVDAHDAPGHEPGKGERILAPDLGIEEVGRMGRASRAQALEGGEFEELSEGRDRGCGERPRPIGKPRNPGIRVIERGVDEERALCRQQDLQAEHLREVEAEDCEPVHQPVAGDPAQGKYLVEARTESSALQFIVQIVGQNKAGGRAVEGGGFLADLGNGEIAPLKDGPDPWANISLPVARRRKLHVTPLSSLVSLLSLR